MSTALMVVIAVVAVLVVAGVAYMVYNQSRTQRLRRAFGPEYDRTVERHDDRSAAERELLERQQRHQELNITELDTEARERYRQQWTLVQEQFVDSPESAVDQADKLVNTVMAERGYPTDLADKDFDERASFLSVEHGRTLTHYRQGHDISVRAARKEATTEDLRQAMVHYRALFEDLLALPKEQRTQVPEVHNDAHTAPTTSPETAEVHRDERN